MLGANVFFPIPYLSSQLLASSVKEDVRFWLPSGFARDIIPTDDHLLAALDTAPEIPKDLLVEIGRLEQKVASLRRRGDHHWDPVFREVGDELWDAGERANGWPEKILADGTLSDVLLWCERDIWEEGEEVGGCFLLDLGGKRVRPPGRRVGRLG